MFLGRFNRSLALLRYPVHHQRPFARFSQISVKSQLPIRCFHSSRPLKNADINRLRYEADRFPSDPNKQAALYRAFLDSGNPMAVIHRFEHMEVEVNTQCTRLYVEALNQIGQGSKALKWVQQGAKKNPTAEYSQSSNGSWNSSTNSNPSIRYPSTSTPNSSPSQTPNPAVAFEGRTGTKDNPIYVVNQPSESTPKQRFWQAVKISLYAWIAIAVASTYAEEISRFSGHSKSYNVISEVGQIEDKNKTYKFADVQGVDDAKEELVEIVEFLRDPEKFTRLGGKLPKGVLLTGPPGTGKTLLARAVAGEAGVPFIYCSGSDFDEMFVGVGAKRVRELFNAAKKRSPCIIFIDEIDAVGSRRHPEDKQYAKMTLNQLLVEMDGFSQTSGIIVIGATNFPESLDKALTRPGRFDRDVVVSMPDVKGRVAILKVHTKKVPLATSVNLSLIARSTPGFSGADLANLINYAALRAAANSQEAVEMKDLEWAKDRILMGTERKNAVISEQNRKVVAFHEAGHALVAWYTDGAKPIYKATIMPRGAALGMVTQLPEDDEMSWTRRQLVANLDVCMGGRCAEELIFGPGEITSGASSDIETATRVARAMVTKFGMGSSALGPVLLGKDSNDYYSLSSQTRQQIEDETRGLIDGAYKRAQDVLKTHRAELDRLANALLEYETLSRDEIERVLRGEKIQRSLDDVSPAAS